MFKDIMLPLDGSHFSELALPLAMQIAQQSKARLHLVRVHTPAVPTAEAVITENYEQLVRDWERDALRVALERATDRGIPATAELLEGQVVSALLDYLTATDVDLVVNGQREQTSRLLAQARCLVMPIRWDEPFGMVMIEAMAQGVPVVAVNRGAVPEVVVHGVTGFVCEREEDLPAALAGAARLNPADCVAHAKERFSPDLMARRYEQVYRGARRPSSVARAARMWEWKAHSSIARRLTPASFAVFQPTVIDMSRTGASGVSGWLGDSHGLGSICPGARLRQVGIVDRLSVPPAITTLSMPARMLAAAVCTAVSPEAQCRFIAAPGTLGIPSSTAV